MLLTIIIGSGLPINCGDTPVDTLTTLVIAPLPGNKPRSLGIDTSGFVEINVAPFLTPNVATQAFHM